MSQEILRQKQRVRLGSEIGLEVLRRDARSLVNPPGALATEKFREVDRPDVGVGIRLRACPAINNRRIEMADFLMQVLPDAAVRSSFFRCGDERVDLRGGHRAVKRGKSPTLLDEPDVRVLVASADSNQDVPNESSVGVEDIVGMFDKSG